MIRTWRDKAIVFPVVLFLEFMLIDFFGDVFQFERVNSLYSFFSGSIIYITILIFLIKILKDHKVRISKTKVPVLGITVLHIIYFFAAYIVISLILATIMRIFS